MKNLGLDEKLDLNTIDKREVRLMSLEVFGIAFLFACLVSLIVVL